MKVKMFDLRVFNKDLKKKLHKSLEKILTHGKLFLGPEINQFEKKISSFTGVNYAMGVSSGSSALYLALRSSGIGQGDEVITTPLSWIITSNAIAACNAKPIFTDVRDDFNIDPISIENKITKKTKAIVPMHYAGHMCDMRKIIKIAKKYNLIVIEDAAQAFGASLNKKMAGSFSIASSISMNPMKVLGGYGEAGIVLTNNKKIFNRLKILRHAGTLSDYKKKITNYCVEVSLNHKMDTLNAALLLQAFKEYKKKYSKINQIAKIYDENLPNSIIRQKLLPNEKHARYAYPILTRNRDKLRKYLIEKNIETKIFHEPLICDAPIYFDKKNTKVPIARQLLSNSLIIPCHDKLSLNQVYYVIENITKFIKKN